MTLVTSRELLVAANAGVHVLRSHGQFGLAFSLMQRVTSLLNHISQPLPMDTKRCVIQSNPATR